MKRLIRVLSIVLFFGLVLVGCSNTETHKTTSNKNHGLVGQTYTGGTEWSNTTNGKATIHFVSKDKAILIESGKFTTDNYWGRLVQDVRYKVIDKKKIKFTILHSEREAYASKADMGNGSVPVLLTPGFSMQSLTNFDTFYIGKNYISFASAKQNKFKLTNRNEISDYSSYIKSVNKKYYGKETKLSDRGFMAPASDLLANGIAFKGSRFIWKYSGPDNKFATDTDQGARMGVFMGTYKLQGDKLTLYNQYHSDVYQGTMSQLSNMEFQHYLRNSDVPKKLTFKFSKNNMLHMMTHFRDYLSDDMLDYGTVDGTPNYKKWTRDEQPEGYAVGMKKAITEDTTAKKDATDNNSEESSSFSSVTDTFPTKDDFAQWVTSYFADQGSEATDDTPGFHVTGSGAGGTVQVRDADNNQSDLPVVYSLAYSYTALNDDSAIEPAQTIAIDSDGNIYSGHFIMLDDDLTQAYADYVSKN